MSFYDLPFALIPLYAIGEDKRCKCGDRRELHERSAGKHPINKKWQEDVVVGLNSPGPHVAPAQIGGLGIVTGEISGIFVLDVDVKDGKDGFKSLENLGEMPATLTVRSPSGGKHFYFKHPEFFVKSNTSGKLGEGLDIIGDGGHYVVGPESPHRLGGVYEIENDVEPAHAPEWLAEWLRYQPTASQEASGVIPIRMEDERFPERLERAIKYLREEAPISVDGDGGGPTSMKIAHHLMVKLELPQPIAHDLWVQQYNPRCVDVHGSPSPWSDYDIDRKLVDGSKNPHGVTPGVASKDFLSQAKPLLEIVDIEDQVPRQKKDPKHQYSYSLGSAPFSGELSGRTFGEVHQTLRTGKEWLGVLQLDSFLQNQIAVNPPVSLDAETSTFSDEDADKIVLWFESKGFSANRDHVFRAVNLICAENSFHPIKEYFESLPPVDPSILDDFGTRIFGCESFIENVAIRKMLIGAVSRVYQPGKLVKSVVVLQGIQDAKKSTFCETLFSEPYFQEGAASLGGKDLLQQISTTWGVELGEMHAVNRAELELVKHFISTKNDKFRPPYAKRDKKFPRQCIFIGTTNRDQFLRDPTGDVRFWPVTVKKLINVSFNRDEVWSAAYQAYLAGEQWWLNEEESKLMDEHRQTFREESPFETQVRKVLEGKTQVRVSDVFDAIFPEADKKNRPRLQEISDCLKKICNQPNGAIKVTGGERVYVVPMEFRKKVELKVVK